MVAVKLQGYNSAYACAVSQLQMMQQHGMVQQSCQAYIAHAWKTAMSHDLN